MRIKIGSLFVALCIILSSLPALMISANAADDHYNLSYDEAIAQINNSSWMNQELKSRFVLVLNSYVPNTDGFAQNKTLYVGNWSAQNCAYLGLYTYYHLFGLYYGRDGAADSNLLLQKATSVSYDSFVANNIKPGAHIRTGYDYGTNGHSMILVDYNPQYIYVYQANRYWTGNGYVGIRVTRYSWDGFNSEEVSRHGQINHISMPKDYESKYSSAGGISTLTITPTNFPSGALTPGAAFYFRGSITSNYPITSATVSVLSGDGTSVVMSKTVNPNKTSVDFLADGLDSLKFGSLPEGSYIMRLQASDSSRNTTEWSSAFTEGTPTEDPTPTILITMTSYPDGSLTQGDPFYLRGSITSNYSITSATVSVVDSDGSTVLTKTVTPNKTSVDILADGLDSLKFGSLSSGSYTLKVAATDSSGTTKEKTFAFTEGAVTYTVSYNANGGSGAPSTQTLAAGETLTVSSTVPTRSGYTFLGWSTNKGATSQDYTSGDTVTVTQNLILYAVWKDKGGDFTPFKERYTYTTGQFSDIPSSSWCANYVSSVYRFGLMKGITDSFFNASGSITVAQAVVIAARIHNIYHNASDEFPEYDSGNWYDGYLEYARENGIVSGSYNMNAAATRGEFAQILAAALPEDDALEGINSVSLSDIPDVNGTESYASAVLRLYRAGVLNGSDSNGTFYGNSTITRAQVSAVVARMVVPSQRIEK